MPVDRVLADIESAFVFAPEAFVRSMVKAPSVTVPGKS